jgi:metallo-beta-lactamase family protein
MKITSWGAAGEVTGSKHLIETRQTRLLLDCGMFQGRRHEADRRNREMGFNADSLTCVLLSHAHIDHSGLLPLLSKKGFSGNVYATHATRDLCSIMLLDSAHIQEKDAAWLSKKNMTYIPPLYGPEDVQEIMRHFIAVSYERHLPVASDIWVRFHDAGHVLGSSMIELEVEEDGQRKTVVFTGDIGRKNMPILEDPWQPREAGLVIMESTYGNREHDPIEQVDQKLAAIIRETHARGGKIIIPTFALERAQEVIYAIKRLETSNAIPDIPVFVDSPLTVNITEIFRLHTEGFDEEFRKVMREAGDPFQLRQIRYIRDVQESMQLNDLEGPAIILSASGMCEFGRIVHHLRNHCEDPRNTILIVGFQAQHTLGRRIVERRKRIKIHGAPRELNARVEVMNEFSAHAGRAELLDFARPFSQNADKVLLVHGEEAALTALQAELTKLDIKDIRIQEEGVAVEY